MDSPHLAAGRTSRLFARYPALLNLILACAAMAISAPVAATDVTVTIDDGERRVAAVAYRLSIANRERCEENIAPQSGFLAQPRGNDEITVTAVMPGSPAEASGLSPGDHVVSVNGRKLSADRATGGTFVQGAAATVGQELGGEPVTLEVVGRDGAREMQFVPESRCVSNVTLIEDEAVNAWADGTDIRITTGLLARCETDDDLALVLGHEMAHNLLRHGQRLADQSGGMSGLLPSSEAVSQELHDTEEEADRVAVALVLAASYDLAGAAAFMDGLLDRSIGESTTHPGPDRRLALLREAIAEAEARSAPAEPLLPRG